MEPLNHRLERTVFIQAAPETVFRFFTDSARWAKWWGAGSTIDARPGGSVHICFPGGVEALGEVLEVNSPHRIVFTYGFATGKPIPPGSSRVTLRLQADALGTRLDLLHEFPDAAVRDEHIQGWRFQLSVFGNVVADEVHSNPDGMVDAWFDAWAEPDEQLRAQAFARIAAPDIRFRDRFSLLEGLADLSAQAGAAQRFMRGIRMRRMGSARHCQGTVLTDWAALAEDGSPRMSGTNVFVLGPDGRIQSATGFLNPPAAR